MACDRYENPKGLPPFPALEGVLATHTGEPGIIVGVDMIGEIVDDVTRSMTDFERVALSDVALVPGDPKCNLCKSGLIPKVFRSFANSALVA